MRGVAFFMISLLLLQERFQHIIGTVFASIFHRFWLPNHFQNALENLSQKMIEFGSDFKWIWEPTWPLFWVVLVAKLVIFEDIFG